MKLLFGHCSILICICLFLVLQQKNNWERNRMNSQRVSAYSLIFYISVFYSSGECIFVIFFDSFVSVVNNR